MIRIVVIMLIMTPLNLFAFTPIHTGHDLYQNLKLADGPQNMDEMINSTYAIGYLKGSVDGAHSPGRRGSEVGCFKFSEE